ncbi:MAG TPA: hypothetical protein VKU86_07395 [Acidimicrobiales bacterium]|nr:hypothetical protein [Acidimicrobiales bacterium]
MNLELTTEQAEDLKTLLMNTVSDLSYEIAATDNAAFRAGLMARRARYNEVLDMVSRPSAERPSDGLVVGPDAVVRELAHPGD